MIWDYDVILSGLHLSILFMKRQRKSKGNYYFFFSLMNTRSVVYEKTHTVCFMKGQQQYYFLL